MVPYSYLIIAQCPHCNDLNRMVEQRDNEVPLIQDVSITPEYCQYCGLFVHDWDVHEEREVV